MDQLTKRLKRTTIFSDLSEDVIVSEILPHGSIRELARENCLIHFQEECNFFGMILSGKVNVMHIYGNGHYGILGILEADDLYGIDLGCTRSRISPYYAMAMQQTKVLSFPVNMIMEPGMISEETRKNILRKMLTYIADENMRKEYRLAILFQKGLRDRIMTFLVMQANKRHTDTFSVPFTRDEMASYLCVNRTCLSHELSQMEKEGIIKFKRNQFTLLNWDKMEWGI